MITAKDLIIPFSFKDRKMIIIDRFLVLPDFYQHQKEEKIDFSQPNIFNNHNPINIEYCSGNGQWLLQKAQDFPHLNWIGIEKRFDRARQIWVKIQNMDIKNILVVFGEGHVFTKFYIKSDDISNVYINFPDPWPKKKHEKNRLVTTLFMNELSRVVKKEGNVTIVTDDREANEWMTKAAVSSNKWTNLKKAKNTFLTDLENYGDSFFKNLWLQKGKEIKYLLLENKK